MNTLCHGAPDEKREAPEQEVYDLLNAHGIPFDRVDHPAAFTMNDCLKVDETLQTEMCKNLFLRNAQKTTFYLLLLRGEKPFKTKDISRQLGISRLSFAEPEYLMQYLHIKPGAVSAMGLIYDSAAEVNLLIDEDLLKNEYLGCHPCVNTASLRLRMEDFLHIFLPAVGHAPTIVTIPPETV